MQRSFTNKNSVKDSVLYIFLFVIYESLSSIYLFLPPLLGLLFILLINALDNNRTTAVLLISFCLAIFEADKGYPLFSSIIFLLISYKFILPRFNYNVNCVPCLKFTYIILAYVGYYLFNLMLANIFLMPIPMLSYYIIYYIVIEFLIVSLL